MSFEHLCIASVPIGIDEVHGTKSYNAAGHLPRRMRYFNPIGRVDLINAATQLGLVFSDIARTPEAQVHAKRTRKGSQTPDKSGHVVLLSADLAVDETLAAMGIAGRKGAKKMLDDELERFHLYCHRRDHARTIEDWHYNWLPNFEAWYQGEARTRYALERFMNHLYGAQYVMDATTVQRALRELRLYGGDIDGKLGPLSKTATEMFQRAYFLSPDGIPGARTQRMLAIVTATYSDGHGRDDD